MRSAGASSDPAMQLCAQNMRGRLCTRSTPAAAHRAFSRALELSREPRAPRDRPVQAPAPYASSGAERRAGVGGALRDARAMLQGLLGPDGSNGSNGSDCSKGSNGSDCSNGSNGSDCSNGSNGSDCSNGSNGSDCSNGSNGSDCSNGSKGPSDLRHAASDSSIGTWALAHPPPPRLGARGRN